MAAIASVCGASCGVKGNVIANLALRNGYLPSTAHRNTLPVALVDAMDRIGARDRPQRVWIRALSAAPTRNTMGFHQRLRLDHISGVTAWRQPRAHVTPVIVIHVGTCRRQCNVCNVVLPVVRNAADSRIADEPIAVFVAAIAANFDRIGVNRRVRIIAIRVVPHVARWSRRTRLDRHSSIAIPIRVDVAEERYTGAALTLIRRRAHLTVRLFRCAGRPDTIIARGTTRIVDAHRKARRRTANIGQTRCRRSRFAGAIAITGRGGRL